MSVDTVPAVHKKIRQPITALADRKMPSRKVESVGVDAELILLSVPERSSSPPSRGSALGLGLLGLFLVF